MIAAAQHCMTKPNFPLWTNSVENCFPHPVRKVFSTTRVESVFHTLFGKHVCGKLTKFPAVQLAVVDLNSLHFYVFQFFSVLFGGPSQQAARKQQHFSKGRWIGPKLSAVSYWEFQAGRAQFQAARPAHHLKAPAKLLLARHTVFAEGAQSRR